MRYPELLVPASSLEVLKTAVIFGADAVYIGGEAFGLRAKAKNFSMEEMKEGIAFAHERQVKVYVTANILAHNTDLNGVREYFQELKEIGPDALIIADPGVFDIAKEVCPEIPRHISTQANNIPVLVPPGSGACCDGKGAFPGRDSGDQKTDSEGYGDRDFYPWSDVYFLFGQMSSEQLPDRPGRQSRSMYSPVSMEIFYRRGDKAGRVYAGL